MKKLLCFFAAALMTAACSNEPDSANQPRNIDPKVRSEAARGLESVTKADKTEYAARLKALVNKCDEPETAIHSDPYVYQQNAEYEAYKAFVTAATERYYLLIDTYLCNEIGGWFPWMFTDMVNVRFPGVVGRSYEKVKHMSIHEQYDAFASVCVADLLAEMSKVK